jgi:acetylornithine deacetylase/succinyl-diaminopimelate desuccinylase-like protein
VEITRLLAELIAIPSVNPMGRRERESDYFESRLTDYLERFFQALHLPVLRQKVAPLRENILARLDPPNCRLGQGPLLLIDVHQDTVPVDQMRIEPFSAETDGMRMYGRGACDVKGGMAAVLNAVWQLTEARQKQVPTIVVACTVNEEHGFTGATELTKLWNHGATSDFLGKKPDACIVTEPTELQVITRHKGVVRWRCHTAGKAAHSSQTTGAENAIYRMGHVLRRLEHYAQQVLPQFGEDTLCGQATLSVGTITGGISVNTIPDRCTIEIDRRLLPTEFPEVAYTHAIDYLETLKNEGIELDNDLPMLSSPGLSDDQNRPLADFLLKATQNVDAAHAIQGAPYGTNAGILAASGLPVVVFGPGSIEQAHTEDEWIDTGQLKTASGILFDLATSQWPL